MLLVPILGALILGSLSLGAYVYQTVTRDLMGTVDAELGRVRVEQGGGRPVDDVRVDRPDRSTAPSPELPTVVLLERDGTPVRIEGEWAPDKSDVAHLSGRTAVETVGHDPRYRVEARPGRDGTTVLVGLPLANVDASLGSLRRNLIAAGLVLVVIQSAIVLWVADRVAGPLVRLSRAVHSVSEGDLDTDLGAPAGSRETATLNADLRAMIATLRATIRERERSAQEADQARADMERFMADAAHELRTPLTALRGYSDLYLDGMLDDEGTDRAMARIGDESARLGSLVATLLDLARPAEDEQWERVDLSTISAAVVYDLRAVYPLHRLSSSVGPIETPADEGSAGASSPIEAPTAGPPTVIGHPLKMHQAVLNLVSNACQHTPTGTTVNVTVQREDESVVLVVADDGPGIDPAQADSLFSPFARGDVSRSRRSHDGAGLGLALVQRIVGQHEGTVVVESSDRGATFRVRLPGAGAQDGSP